MANSVARLVTVVVVAALMFAVSAPLAHADEAAEIDAEVDAGLRALLNESPELRELAEKSAGILLFPRITKMGLVAGAAGGKGALRVKGNTVGYYRSRAVSVGYQAGIQSYGYALFLIGDEDLMKLQALEGSFDIESAPSLVIADQGFIKEIGTRNLDKGTVAVFFSQEGLMAGAGLQATKIARIDPK
jgi:lipid-binding SYLF domain-containing protein